MYIIAFHIIYLRYKNDNHDFGAFKKKILGTSNEQLPVSAMISTFWLLRQFDWKSKHLFL